MVEAPSDDEMARHIDAYEHLRGAVLRAQARPEGLAAMAYHGMLGGLKVICATGAPAAKALSVPAVTPAAAAPSLINPALIRLLANMVLFHQEEASHVV